ncbi:hypothetical protein F4678DRAFT_430435 [Xylaria arbuscula]|nr:hypothetical protein F4678DRAFT_430435 [Xylaria arbuscula]
MYSPDHWLYLCGMNIMMYYILYRILWRALKPQIASPLTTASIQYVINVALTLPAILCLYEFGCWPALIVGTLFMMILSFTFSALEAAYSQHKGIVVASYLFVATFAISWRPTPRTYPAEIFPRKVHAKAVSLSTASNWFWNLVLAFAVPPLLWPIDWKMYMIFAVSNGAAFIRMTRMAPETKGYILEEIDEVFDSGQPAWKTYKKTSRLDQLAQNVELGHVKVTAPRREGSTSTSTAVGSGTTGEANVEKPDVRSQNLEMSNEKGSQG